MPEISIIIPVYNVENHLKECLASVTNQTFKDFEAICVEDGSSDSSLGILEEHAKKDARIRVISQTNKGLSVARNVGLDNASGKYLFFVDSDDFLHLEALETLHSLIEKTRADVVCSGFEPTYPKRKSHAKQIKAPPYRVEKKPLEIFTRTINRCPISVWNKLFRREVFDKWRFIPGIYFEDWPLMICMFSEVDSCVQTPVVTYYHRCHSESIMHSPLTVKKIDDYMVGIHFVSEYYKKQNKESLWRVVKRKRIARTITILLKALKRNQNNDNISVLQKHARAGFQSLRKNNLISYRGLSLKNKLRLFSLLNAKPQS